MNKMKKVLLLALSLAMSATLFAACGKDKGGNIIIPDSSASTDSGSTDTSDSVDDSDSNDDSSSEEPGVTKYTFTKIDGNPRDPNATIISVELEAGEALDLTPPAEAEGKTFGGWIDVEGNLFEGTTMPEDHLALYAIWEITPYTVTIKQDGKEDSVLTFGVEQDINKEIIGIDTIGWMVEQALPEDTDDTIYAFAEALPETWELKNYTFTIVATTTKYTFTKIDGNPKDPNATIITEKLEVGEALDLSAPETVEGKVFKGWVDGEGNVYNGATMPEDHLTLYASWEITPYTVTLKLDGEVYKTLKFGVESDYNDLENPIIGRNELSFALEGELPAGEGEIYYAFAEELPETWELKEYTIEIVAKVKTYTFTKINGNPRMGGTVTEVELKAGEALDLSAPEAVEGKVFNGWIDVEGNPVEEGAVMGSEPIAIYADWTITPYTVTLTINGAAYKTFTFGVESDYDDLDNPIIGINEIGWVLEGEIPEDTKIATYTVELPEVWELQDYEIDITCVKTDDEDLASSIKFFDRLNQKIMMADGSVKTNKDNYWDGTANSVTVGNQKEVTNGSDFANKLTIDYNKLTAEEKAAGLAAYSTWKGEMWVAFAIPVSNLDLTSYEITFDMKGENLGAEISAYAAQDYEGDQDAIYAFGKEGRYKQSEYAVDLGDGWYRWTITIDCENGVGKAADYVILSLDNTPDTSKETVIYLDNVSMQEVFYYNVTLDGVTLEETVRGGSQYTPAAPSKDGYAFMGWVDAEGNEVTTPILVEGDIELTSTWEKLPHMLKVNEALEVNLEGTAFEIVEFSAPAGTYDIVVSGGIRVFTIVDGERTDEVVTQFVFDEQTTVQFAVMYGRSEDGQISRNGTISATCDMTVGLERNALANQLVKDCNQPNQESTDVNGVAYKEYRAFVNGSTATAVTEGIPEGFEKVLRLDWYSESYSIWKVGGASANPLYRSCFNQDDISAYQVVQFAFMLETNGDAFVGAKGGTVVFESNQWLFVELIQTSSNVWDLLIKNADGNILYSVSGLTRLTDGLTACDSVASLVFPSVWDAVAGKTTHALAFYSPTSKDMTASIYMTEIVAWGEPAPPYDPGISAEAVEITNAIAVEGSANAGFSIVENTEEVPYGFNSVTAFKSEKQWGSYILATGDLSAMNVAKYSEVWFAVKMVNGHMTETAPEWKDIDNDTTSPWVYFHLIQQENTLTNTSGGVATAWTIEIRKEDGTLFASIADQHANSNDTLGRILDWVYAKVGDVVLNPGDNGYDNGRIVFYQDRTNLSEPTYLYSTNVVGVEKEAEPFNPAISEDATIVWDHIWNPAYFTGGSLAEEGAYSDMEAPLGFTKTSESTWTGKDFAWRYNHFNATDLSGYSDIYFAMRADAPASIYLQGAPGNGMIAGEWVYVHMYQAEDGTWSKDFYTASGFEAKGVQTGLTGKTLSTLMGYGSGFNQGSYPTAAADATATAYFTEVLGVAKAYDPEISVDAVKINNGILTDISQWSHVALNEDVSGVKVPNGFNQVIRYDSTTWTSSALGNNNFNQADLGDYSEVWFAAKVEGGYWKFNGCGGDKATSSWVYFHLTQTGEDENGNILWKIEATIDGEVFTTIENQSGAEIGKNQGPNSIAAMFYDSSYSSADGNAIMIYYGGTGVSIYATEMVGVRKPFDPAIPENATLAMEHFWRESDAYPCTNVSASVEAPKGFSSVYKDDWNSHHATITAQYTYTMNSAFDITQYSDLYFAMKLENGTHIYVRANGSDHYKGTDWLYVHYHQNEDGTWTMSVESADGYEAVSQQTYTATNMKALLENNLYGHRTDVTLNTCTYFTEVLGIAKVVEEA